MLLPTKGELRDDSKNGCVAGYPKNAPSGSQGQVDFNKGSLAWWPTVQAIHLLTKSFLKRHNIFIFFNLYIIKLWDPFFRLFVNARVVNTQTLAVTHPPTPPPPPPIKIQSSQLNKRIPNFKITCLKKLLTVSVTGLKFVRSGTGSNSAPSAKWIDFRLSYTELRLERSDEAGESTILDCCKTTKDTNFANRVEVELPDVVYCERGSTYTNSELRDQTARQVVAYKRFQTMEIYKTVSTKSGRGRLR